MSTRAVVVAAALAAVLSGCYREKREFESPPDASPPDPLKASALLPGDGPALSPGTQPTPGGARLQENAFAVNQGKRLFRWYNCSGCHSNGGGGMGAVLMDRGWRYGSAPSDVYRTIVEGRPNGMPAFGGRIPDEQVWQLVAYVRSLSGRLRKDVAPSRADSLAGAPPENTRPEEAPEPEKPTSSPR